MADLIYDLCDSTYQRATLEDDCEGQSGDHLRPDSPPASAENILHNSRHWVMESDKAKLLQREIIVDSVYGDSKRMPDSSRKAEPPMKKYNFLPQLQIRPISMEQLVAEVKGIYAGIVIVEGKCIEVDLKQAALTRDSTPESLPKLNKEQWQALIALHWNLLHEHHDFFLALQHSSSQPIVRKLANKYAMPVKLWCYGIHTFLELLCNRLPDSMNHMLDFIYLAYSMMVLLYETVPIFEESWIEYLGDITRYRIVIEEDDI
jgi:hypothetical protein